MTEGVPSNRERPSAELVSRIVFARDKRLSGYNDARAIAGLFLNSDEALRELTAILRQNMSKASSLSREDFVQAVRVTAENLSLSTQEIAQLDNFAYALMEAFGGAVGPNGFVDLTALN